MRVTAILAMMVALISTAAVFGSDVQAKGKPFSLELKGDVTKPINEITDAIGGILSRNKYSITIINRSSVPLRRIADYNNSSAWPIVDVGPKQVKSIELEVKSFSFGAAYTFGNWTLYFTASSPVVGSDKINMVGFPVPAASVARSTLQTALKATWEKMDDSDMKVIDGGRHRAYIKSTGHGNNLTFIFEIDANLGR